MKKIDGIYYITVESYERHESSDMVYFWFKTYPKKLGLSYLNPNTGVQMYFPRLNGEPMDKTYLRYKRETRTHLKDGSTIVEPLF